jgi:antitoxin (DNA-binding transcriptional repressor) of toxin-antitoxin stability system
MKAVNVAELKRRLSHYLRLVRRGEAFLVRDGDRVIARLEPAGAEGEDRERLSSLEQRGIIRRARAPLTRDLLARRPRVEADVLAALLREREEAPGRSRLS